MEWPAIYETSDISEANAAMNSGQYRAPEYDRDLHKYVFIKRTPRRRDDA